MGPGCLPVFLGPLLPFPSRLHKCPGHRVPEAEDSCHTEGLWGSREVSSGLGPLPCGPGKATCRLWGGQGHSGESWLSTSRRLLAGSPGLALLKARAVNSALLKMSNKGEKERKEKGEGGGPGWEWGRQGLREQVGTI